MPCVYALSISADPEAFRYVGVSKHDTATQRYREHVKAARAGRNLPVSKWVASCMKNSIEIQVKIIRVFVDYQDALDFERELIATLREQKANLLNITEGGRGTVGWIHTESARQRISQAQKDRVRTDQERRRISEALTGKTQSEESRMRNRLSHMTKTHCRQGHEYTEDNTKWRFRKGKEDWPTRTCKTCVKINNALRARQGLTP